MFRLIFLLVFLALPLAADDFEQPKVEVGVLLGGIKEPVLGEYPVVAGGRVSVHVFRFMDAEAEVSRHPIGGAVSLYPATQVMMGARAGRRFGMIGLYGKVRPGFMQFDTNAYVPRLGTQAALDAGGILEFYSRRHVAMRVDFGDTVVWYGRDITIPQSSGTGMIPGVRHQFQWSIGVSAWF